MTKFPRQIFASIWRDNEGNECLVFNSDMKCLVDHFDERVAIYELAKVEKIKKET